MNIDRLTKLAEWLEAGAPHERIRFDMREGIAFDPEQFSPRDLANCGTSCCLAGAAVQFFGSAQRLSDDGALWGHFSGVPKLGWPDVRDEAMELLNLESPVADDLFQPIGVADFDDEYLWFFNDPARAAATVRKLIATGEVDWGFDPEASQP